MRINVEINGVMIPVELTAEQKRMIIDEALVEDLFNKVEAWSKDFTGDDGEELTGDEIADICGEMSDNINGMSIARYMDYANIGTFVRLAREKIDARPKAKVFEVIISYRCEFTKRVKAMSREEAENFLDNADLDYLGESRSIDVEWEDYDTYEDGCDDDYDFDATEGC